MSLTRETRPFEFGARSLVHLAFATTPRTHAASLGISLRDRVIVAGALRRLAGVPFRFEDALRALRDSTEATIAAGRVFYLGATTHGPIIGSAISGVGIASFEGMTELVRVDRRGLFTRLGRLVP